MELQQLKYFYVIAQCESLTKAAQKLHTSQPSLSRSLHALEDELGTPLFDRIGRNIVLNDAGRFALIKIKEILASADNIKRDMDKFVHDENMSVDLYSPVPMGEIEKIIIGFKKEHPAIRLRMASWPSASLKNIQPNITFFASSTVHKEPNYLLLGEENIILAVSPRSTFANRESIELASLSNEWFVSVLSDSPFYNLSASMFAQAGFEPKFIAEDQDYNRILAYVAHDFGIALAPSITWFGTWKEEVIKIPISDIQRKRYLYLKWPENEIMNWATLQFREYVIKHFNENYGFSCGTKQDPPPIDYEYKKRSWPSSPASFLCTLLFSKFFLIQFKANFFNRYFNSIPNSVSNYCLLIIHP